MSGRNRRTHFDGHKLRQYPLCHRCHKTTTTNANKARRQNKRGGASDVEGSKKNKER